MFECCKSLATLNISSFDTKQVTNMRQMFSNCTSLTTLDISHFNTANTMWTDKMFYNCTALTSIDFSNFDSSYLLDMNRMFACCKQLQTILLGKIKVDKNVKMQDVFSNCLSLTTIVCRSDSNFDDLKRLLENCALLRYAVDYEGCRNLLEHSDSNSRVTIPLHTPLSPIFEAYVVLSADQTTLTFYYDNLRFSHPTPSWKIDELERQHCVWSQNSATIVKVIFDPTFQEVYLTTLSYWFNDLSSLTTIEGLQYLDTSDVTDMSHMFDGCSSLTTLDLSHFDTMKVTDMSWMFYNCEALTTLNLSNFYTAKVKNMSWMFGGCSSLIHLDLSHFYASRVKNTIGMFAWCYSLLVLDISNFRNNATETSFMFVTNSALTTIYCNYSWHCDDSEYMFSSCTSLKGAVAYDETKTNVRMANPETGYFTSRR